MNTLSFVCIHGGWHSSYSYTQVKNIIENQGHTLIAVDLPGAGSKAKTPASFVEGADASVFATEPSLTADVTQQDRTAHVIDVVRKTAEKTATKPVLVGHSMGGLTVSHVGETIPDELSAVVYLAAFMLPSQMTAFQMKMSKFMAESLVPSLLMADPEQVGALRVDGSKSKQAFYADMTDVQIQNAIAHLHYDEPVSAFTVPSPVTPQKFGKIPRYYIQCMQDKAMMMDAQDEYIRLADEAYDTKTVVYKMDTSHSPFYSQPQQLSDILMEIGNNVFV